MHCRRATRGSTDAHAVLPTPPLRYIEQLIANEGIRQMWFLDDGMLRGKSEPVCNALNIMTRELAKINLQINVRKCELYLPANGNTPPGFGSIPVVRDRNMWSYLGTPLSEETTKALESAQRRIKQAAAKLSKFAATHPKQSFQLLRATAGACKIEYLLQTLTRSALTDQLVADCSADMRQVYAAILRQEIDDFTWAHATLPQRDGGFGLRDPTCIAESARLASLVNVAERALGFGAAKSHIDAETAKAAAIYTARIGTDRCSELHAPSELKKTITQLLHAKQWIG